MATACPYCGSTKVDAEFVDVGVGFQQVTPYSCGECMAQQMNPYRDNSRATEEEQKTGWWRGPRCMGCMDKGEVWVVADDRYRPCEDCKPSTVNPYDREPENLVAIKRGLLARLPPRPPAPKKRQGHG